MGGVLSWGGVGIGGIGRKTPWNPEGWNGVRLGGEGMTPFDPVGSRGVQRGGKG